MVNLSQSKSLYHLPHLEIKVLDFSDFQLNGFEKKTQRGFVESTV